jgi:hypothetical protein
MGYFSSLETWFGLGFKTHAVIAYSICFRRGTALDFRPDYALRFLG